MYIRSLPSAQGLITAMPTGPCCLREISLRHLDTTEAWKLPTPLESVTYQRRPDDVKVIGSQ
jgi:hypothetical protein